MWVTEARDRPSSCFRKVHEHRWTEPVARALSASLYSPGGFIWLEYLVLGFFFVFVFDCAESSEVCRKQNDKTGA